MEPGHQNAGCALGPKPVDADKEKHPNNMNVNEMMLVKLHSSEERCCIIIIFAKQAFLQYGQPLIWSPPLEHSVLVTLYRTPRPPVFSVTSACAREHGLTSRAKLQATVLCTCGARPGSQGRAPADFQVGILSKAPRPEALPLGELTM